MRAVNASGDQVVLTAGDVRLTVVTAGGGIRELTRGDWSVLDGYGIDELPPGASGQPLIPWPNRIRGGRYEFQGKRYQVPITEPDLGNALHGFVRWMAWNVERASDSNAVLSLLMYPRAGYPFALYVETEYSVHPFGVEVATTAHNACRLALPYACGFHPYICVGAPTIDTCILELPAQAWLPADEQQIPIGRESVAGTGLDFRSPRTIGPVKLDTAFTDLTRDGDGMASVKLSAADGSRSIAVRMDPTYDYVMVYTGDKLEPPRRRRGLGVEPMTAAPNAFQSGEGLRVIDPGDKFTCRWGIEIRGG